MTGAHILGNIWKSLKQLRSSSIQIHKCTLQVEHMTYVFLLQPFLHRTTPLLLSISGKCVFEWSNRTDMGGIFSDLYRFFGGVFSVSSNDCCLVRFGLFIFFLSLCESLFECDRICWDASSGIWPIRKLLCWVKLNVWIFVALFSFLHLTEIM